MAVAARRRVYEILDIGRPNDRQSRIADIIIITLVSLNVLAVILESIPSLVSEFETFFAVFEIFSVFVFSVEYLLRLWSTVEEDTRKYKRPVVGRIRYMLTPMALIDLIAILPFYLGFFVDFDLRFMRVLRLLRVFKLTRYSASMSLLLNVLKDESRAIGAAFFVLFLLIIMAASLTFLAEHEAQPEAFGTIPDAMWWAIITMTTVGYGDVTPVTALGKIFGAVISIISVGMVALPAGLLASGFTEALRRRRKEFEDQVEDALEDGIIDAHEVSQLEKSQETLGISQEDAKWIMKHGGKKSGQKIGACPHCGKPLFR